MERPILWILLGINLLTFLVYGLDKWKARTARWRVPEAHLLFLILIGGAPAAWMAMRAFRHKTIKSSFRWKAVAATLLCLAWLGYSAWLLLATE